MDENPTIALPEGWVWYTSPYDTWGAVRQDSSHPSYITIGGGHILSHGPFTPWRIALLVLEANGCMKERDEKIKRKVALAVSEEMMAGVLT